MKFPKPKDDGPNFYKLHSKKKFFIGAIVTLCFIIFTLTTILIVMSIVDESSEENFYCNQSFLFESKIIILESKIDDLNKVKKQNNLIIEEKQKIIEFLNKKLDVLSKEISALYDSIRKKNELIVSFNKTQLTLKLAIKNDSKYINKLNVLVENNNKEIYNLNSAIKRNNKEINRRTMTILDLFNLLNKLKLIKNNTDYVDLLRDKLLILKDNFIKLYDELECINDRKILILGNRTRIFYNTLSVNQYLINRTHMKIEEMNVFLKNFTNYYQCKSLIEHRKLLARISFLPSFSDLLLRENNETKFKAFQNTEFVKHLQFNLQKSIFEIKNLLSLIDTFYNL